MVQRVHTNGLCGLADRCGAFVLARSDPDTAFLFQAQQRGFVHYTIISMNKSPQSLSWLNTAWYDKVERPPRLYHLLSRVVMRFP
jgi:hypothetical protein